MKTMSIIGIILIVLGAIALAYGGITYTRDDKVVDIGPLEVEAEKRETIPLPPVLGGAAILVGIIILVSGRSGRTNL